MFRRDHPQARRWPSVVFVAAGLLVGVACTAQPASTVASTTLSPLTPGVTATDATDATTTAVAATAAPTTTVPPTSTITPTTTIPIVAEGAIVKVANAADAPGAAAALTADLQALGFQMAEPTNGAGVEPIVDLTKVYVLRGTEAGSQPVAESVALQLGGVAVLPRPSPPPLTGALEGLADATVLVMLGGDLAGKTLPGPPG